MRLVFPTLVLVGLLLLQPPLRAGLRIAEIQAANSSTIENHLGDRPDWIEILNDGETTVHLEGYFLTDDPDNLNKWAFPKLTLSAGRRLVVWASGNDSHALLTLFEPPEFTKTHTNFRLSSGGEYLAIVSPDERTIVDEIAPAFPPMGTDISYGLTSEGQMAYFLEPTPGQENPPLSENVGPVLKDAENLTGQPDLQGSDADEEVVVSVRAIPVFGEVSQVRLYRRFMFKDESRIVMSDDGVAPDETADDGVYTAAISLKTIFGTSVAPGEMLRWRFEAEDELGNVTRLPRFWDPKDSDEYFGTVAEDVSDDSSNLTILHTFIETPTAANTESGTRGAVFYLGEFYDNVQFDIHGQSTRSFPKKSYDVDFNRGNRFRYHEDEGRVKDFNLLTNWADKSKVRNTMAYEMYSLAGVRGHWAFPVRVHQNGEFHSTADMVEDADERYLERVGLNDQGALYKMYNRLDSANGAEKKSREWEDNDDLEDFIDGITQGSSSDKEIFVYDNVDIAATVNFLAANSLVNNTDYGHKNYFVYRDSDQTNEWTELPWDVDLSLGRRWISSETYFHDPIQTTHSPVENHVHGNRLGTFFMSNSTFNEMIWIRLRTLMDEFYGPPGEQPSNDYMLRRLDELVELIDPDGVESDADLDYEKWGSWGNRDTMREGVARIRDEYIPGRRDYIYGQSKLPNRQSSSPEFVVAGIDFSPASDNQEEEYVVLQNLSSTPMDISNWTLEGAVEHTFAAGTIVMAGTIFTPDAGKLYLAKNSAAFRERQEEPTGGQKLYVQSGYIGQLSARGETLIMRDADRQIVMEHTYEGDPSPAQDALRITEVHFQPNPGDTDEFFPRDFEFIEVQNTSGASLDLAGVYFSDGIDFVFPEGAGLEAGAYGVVVANAEAFAQRYGTDLNVLGVYSGQLDNGGERIQLNDHRGENVLKFTYDDEWLTEAQAGHAITFADTSLGFDRWDGKDNWNASAAVGGTPGAGEGPVNPDTGYDKWAASHFTAAEIADPAVSGPSADANGDGLTNLMAYALGQGPRESNYDRTPQWTGEDNTLALQFRAQLAAEDLVFDLESSVDLQTWKTAAFDETSRIDEGDGTSTVEWKPSDLQAGQYYRIRINLGDPRFLGPPVNQ